MNVNPNIEQNAMGFFKNAPIRSLRKINKTKRKRTNGIKLSGEKIDKIFLFIFAVFYPIFVINLI